MEPTEHPTPAKLTKVLKTRYKLFTCVVNIRATIEPTISRSVIPRLDCLRIIYTKGGFRHFLWPGNVQASTPRRFGGAVVDSGEQRLCIARSFEIKPSGAVFAMGPPTIDTAQSRAIGAKHSSDRPALAENT